LRPELLLRPFFDCEDGLSEERCFYVYLVADRSRVLYVGFTSDIKIRVKQHREVRFEGFTSVYRCDRLVWFERFTSASAAIAREKQIKRWRREKKVVLIERENPTWEDLSLVWDGPVERYRSADDVAG
jgi:putative endonuclease